jgi:type I restriction enzyme S subunit
VEFPTNDLQTIVSFFDAMQQVIAGKRELISKYRELKINTINRVFSYGLEKQQDENEDFGKYPKGWKVGRISDVANVITGGTPDRDNKEFWDGDIPWVTTGEINYKDITSTIEKITQEGLNNSAAKIIPSRSILLAMYGQGVTRGKVAMLRIEAATNQACAAIITNNRVISEFLYYYLSSRYMEIRNLAHGANQQNLNLQLVKSIPIVYPEKKSEQEKIVEILHALDEKINAVQNDKLLNEELFNSALNKYLCQNN